MFRPVLAFSTLMTLVFSGTGQAIAQSELRYTVVQRVQTQTEAVFVSSVGSCDGLRGTINDINDKGEVVGFLPKDDTRGNAFLWTGEELTRLKSGKGGAVGLALNNTGTIAGVSFEATRIEECEIGQQPVPAQWVDGAFSRLELPPGANRGFARDVNDDGLIAGEIGLETEIEDTLPVVWNDGSVKILSVQVQPGSPVGEYSSSTTYNSASVTSVDDAGRLYGWGEVIDDRGIRPWQFPLIWSDSNAEPVVVGDLGASIRYSGGGSHPVGTIIDDDYNVFPIQYQDETTIILPSPDPDGDIFSIDTVGSSDDDQIILGNYGGVEGYGPCIWDMRSGDPASIPVHDLRSITDGEDDLKFEIGIGTNASGQILVQAKNTNGVRFFLILEPSSD